MENDRNETLFDRCVHGTPQGLRTQALLLMANLLWAASLLGSVALIRLNVLPDGPIAWLVASAPTVTGVGVMIVFWRFLRQADELQRLIQLHALALAAGVGIFGSAGYTVFERLGAPRADASGLIVTMTFFYIVGMFLGWRRYR